MDRVSVSRKFFKNPSNTNPALSNWFCADPAAIEYDGRIYVYGSNDNQQYEIAGDFGQNTYEKIKSIVCFSTQDMVNWTFHGAIDVDEVSPWSLTSWSPVVISRKEEDGLTHFYMYYSNSGCGVCVMTATNPLGPWKSPLDKPLINMNMPGIEELTNPFDPGACIDDKGEGWLVFGGGYTPDGDDVYPGSVRIVKLGKDLISLDSEFVEIKAPYFFESSRIDFIDGFYVYSFNSNWVERKFWNYDVEKSTQCSMNYMVTKTPLISDSWKYAGNYFKNPGDQGLNYSNNHTFFVNYKNRNYLFYHTLTLQEDMDTNGGFRSICVDNIQILSGENGNPPVIKMCNGTRNGVNAVDVIDGFSETGGNTIHTSAEISYVDLNNKANKSLLGSNLMDLSIGAKANAKGAWYSVKAVDFGSEAKKIQMQLIADTELFENGLNQNGQIEVRLNKLSGPTIALISDFEEGKSTYEADFLESVSGVNDLFFVFGSSGLIIKSWQFLK